MVPVAGVERPRSQGPMPPPPTHADEGSLHYPGWRLVVLCFVMALVCWGLGFYGHGFYLAELRRQHGWPTALISSASTAYYLFSAVLVIFISDAIRRFGVRACVLTGGLAFAFSTAALPLITAPWHLFAVYLVMGLGWATMSVGAITNILGLWFDQKRGLAISLALNGASLSGVIVIPLLVLLTEARGFLVAMIGCAAVMVGLFLPLVVLLVPDARLAPPLQRAEASAAPATVDRSSALSTVAFWSISAPFALAIFSQAGFLVHQLAFLEPTIGRSEAGLAVAITTAMAIVGRLTLGALSQRINQRLASALSLVSQAGALAIMAGASDRQALFAASALYGFSVGNVITFPALIVQREFDAAAFGMLVGLATGISQITYAFGPGVLGLLRDATGGYTASLGLCIGLNLLAAAIVVRRPRPGPGRSSKRRT
jgi:MFS family permease